MNSQIFAIKSYFDTLNLDFIVVYQALVWGSNSEGQAGTGSPQSILIPQQLVLPENKLIRDIASGDDFIVVVSLDGFVYYVGTIR